MRLNVATMAFALLLPIMAGAGDKGCSCTTAKITSATLAHGYDEQGGKAIEPTGVFRPTDTVFHLVVNTAHVPPGTKIAAEWWAVAAGGEQNVRIDAATLEMPSSEVVHFTLSRDQGWPEGSYKVIVSIDDKPVQTLTFDVKQ